MDDKTLVEKLLNRDEKSLFTVYSTYRKPLYNFIYKKLQDKTVAEELVQDVFIHFLESLRDFRFQSSIKTFIYTIARNKTIDYMRKKKIKRIVFSHMPSFIVEGLTQIDFDEELEKKDLQERLENAFDKLPHEYEVVLRLKYIDDESVQSIAQTLFKSFKSTESLLFRARRAFIKVYSALH